MIDRVQVVVHEWGGEGYVWAILPDAIGYRKMIERVFRILSGLVVVEAMIDGMKAKYPQGDEKGRAGK